MVRTKVFVGNLSFKTTETELAKEFGVCGTVVSANIITRGPRSLGYGFVELENEQDAEKAVKLLNKKEIDGRPINVELAKPREEGEEEIPTEGAATRGRGGRRGTRGAFRARGGRGGRGGSFPRGGGAVGGGGFTRGTGVGAFRARGRGGRGRGRGNVRPPIEERNTTPSKTSVFVANLPFKLEDEGFATIFQDQAMKVKSAKVVRKPNGQSKGFGFVEFESEADQKKAVALGKTEVEGRELVIRIALNEIETEGSAEHKEEEKAPKKEEPKKEEKKEEKKEVKKEEVKEEPKKEAPKKEEPKKEVAKPAPTKKEQPAAAASPKKEQPKK